MLTQEQKDRFFQDGFTVVPNVLNTQQVEWLRTFLRPKFDLPIGQRQPGDNDKILFDIFSRYPELHWLLFHQPAIAALKSLLGEDFVVLREASVHLNGFGGWHKDTTSQETAGHKFQWDEDYLMVEAGYYLQDNTVEFGGGLDVEPGTHLLPDRFVQATKRGLLHRIGRRAGLINSTNGIDNKKVVSIPSKAGDLVIFHFRVNHRATPRTAQALPPEREKLAVFLACSRNTSQAQAYHDYISSRPDYVYLQNFAYPADLLQQAREHGLTLA